jgi:hypothetical protein
MVRSPWLMNLQPRKLAKLAGSVLLYGAGIAFFLVLFMASGFHRPNPMLGKVGWWLRLLLGLAISGLLLRILARPRRPVGPPGQ